MRQVSSVVLLLLLSSTTALKVSSLSNQETKPAELAQVEDWNDECGDDWDDEVCDWNCEDEWPEEEWDDEVCDWECECEDDWNCEEEDFRGVDVDVDESDGEDEDIRFGFDRFGDQEEVR